MNHYVYTGVTAYVRNNDLHTHALRILAEAIYPLMAFTDMKQELVSGAENIMQRPEFELVEKYVGIYTVKESCMPNGIPLEYQDVAVTEHVIKDENLIRLYFPVTSQHDTEKVVTHGLIPLLESLYRTDLLCVKTITATNNESFHEAPVKTVLSTERFK